MGEVKLVHFIAPAVALISLLGGAYFMVKLDDYRISQLEAEVAALEQTVRTLELEWAVHVARD